MRNFARRIYVIGLGGIFDEGKPPERWNTQAEVRDQSRGKGKERPNDKVNPPVVSPCTPVWVEEIDKILLLPFAQVNWWDDFWYMIILGYSPDFTQLWGTRVISINPGLFWIRIVYAKRFINSCGDIYEENFEYWLLTKPVEFTYKEGGETETGGRPVPIPEDKPQGGPSEGGESLCVTDAISSEWTGNAWRASDHLPMPDLNGDSQWSLPYPTPNEWFGRTPRWRYTQYISCTQDERQITVGYVTVRRNLTICKIKLWHVCP